MPRHLKNDVFIFLAGLFPVVASGQVLDVPEVVQEQTEWCWAGVSCCVLNYYGKPVTQCAIAEYARTKITWYDFGTENCCDVGNRKCNYWNYNFGYPGSIEDILKQWGVQNHGTGNSLTPASIKTEVGAGRPFIIRWALKPSGGHFIVGHGIADSTVYYMDPWRGEGYKIAKYSAVASNSSHTWQGTNVITTNPGPKAVVLVQPVDSSRNQSRSPTFVWHKAGSASYQFQCAGSATFGAPLIRDTSVTADTTLLLPGLSPATTYFWRVRAKAGADTGTWSAVWRFTTEPATSVLMQGRLVQPITCIRRSGSGLTIGYTVPASSQVTIRIFTLRGALQHSIEAGFQTAGTYSRYIPAENLSAGNYLLTLSAGKFRATLPVVF
jgi:uncharacterized protein YvpB